MDKQKIKMIKNPKVSIITSVFKSEKFISHFLSDVARQTIFLDCELILLNANSPENEEEYILEFQKCFPKNVVYKKLDKQYSVYETWNMGIEISNSNILANWNTDDRRVFNSLEKQWEEFDKDSELDVCYGPTLTTYIPNESVEFCKSKEGFGCYPPDFNILLKNNSPHCFPMWRKRIQKKYGLFETKYKIAADYEMWLRAMVGGAKFKMINTLIGSYYRNPLGASSNPDNLELAFKEIEEIRSTYSAWKK